MSASDVPAVIDTPERVPRASMPRPAESLRPTLNTMEAAISGSARAKAIIEAWRFKIDPRSVSYCEMTRAELEALSNA